MPCVINLSMGFNGGGHDGNMVIEWIIDALMRKSGRAIVIAAGNENGPDKASTWRQRKEGHSVELEWENGLFLPTRGSVISHGDPTPNEVEIWYPVGSSLRFVSMHPGKIRQRVGRAGFERGLRIRRRRAGDRRFGRPHPMGQGGPHLYSAEPGYARKWDSCGCLGGRAGSHEGRDRMNPLRGFATMHGSNAPSRTRGLASCDRDSRILTRPAQLR